MANPQLAESYRYLKPTETYTLDQYIASDSENVMNYINTSYLEKINHIKFSVYNIMSDYIEDLHKDYCVKVELSNDELMKYRYKPKLLCHDIYKNGELAYLILLINDMYSVKQFTKSTLLLPRTGDIKEICECILNSNGASIDRYNRTYL